MKQKCCAKIFVLLQQTSGELEKEFRKKLSRLLPALKTSESQNILLWKGPTRTIESSFKVNGPHGDQTQTLDIIITKETKESWQLHKKVSSRSRSP